MKTSIAESDSIVASLSREVYINTNRSIYIKSSLDKINNESLMYRLQTELKSLNQRSLEIINMVNSINKKRLYDNLSLQFLKELCNRSINYTESLG